MPIVVTANAESADRFYMRSKRNAGWDAAAGSHHYEA
jgi:hypothetical protein